MKSNQKSDARISGSISVSIFATILLGAFGGGIFYYFQMPLAWMIGAMAITTAASLFGAPLKGSNRLRSAVLPILGVMLGSAFGPEVVSKVGKWIPSLITMCLFIIVVTSSVSLLFIRLVKVDAVTSYFCATPGGLATMTVLGSEKGGDEQTIALTHSIRIFLTVLIIPFWFKIFGDFTLLNKTNLGALEAFHLRDLIMLIFCGLIGFYGGKLMRLPSFQLLGPMILSAAIHISGVTDATPPSEIVNIAQIILGSGIGARFASVSITQVSRVLISAVMSTIYILLLAAGVSYLLEQFTGLPFYALLTAFSPGGLAEMTLISLSMGIDPAFVSTHHLLRVSLIILMAAPTYHFFKKMLEMHKKN